MHCDIHWQARVPLVGQSISSGPEIGVLLHAMRLDLPTLQHPSLPFTFQKDDRIAASTLPRLWTVKRERGKSF
jgi:hypothetical protein